MFISSWPCTYIWKLHYKLKHDNPFSRDLLHLELLVVDLVCRRRRRRPVENHMEIAIEFELNNGGGHDASLTEPFFIKTDCSKKWIFIFCLTCLKYMEICYRI